MVTAVHGRLIRGDAPAANSLEGIIKADKNVKNYFNSYYILFISYVIINLYNIYFKIFK